ncbi:type III secretion system export apparatus subunit SctT [Acidovorax sp. SUPP950]|uniref:type III secretion system export apparatus subunit SctT n=1 Tax=unclassified Acidovorax TaxID=2684926 RepID=UPI0023C57790|nr:MULTISPECIES: type III secretion system export apparatus subunit SctT [Comamonadaceae]WOI44535.1 type III secretion system export apparatus subunit SctT [Paracidovorax avenae]GKS77021.1 type III secretion system export apparatus subunit SctT [Acidovorax sp. SUPP950]GKS85378.1 type III secretion system export apparatus subunit SctT [Acidovorax sp. SUPP1855]GKS93449.1 type III secretion system export apparatus subunit SctT [Acidovorax sp. SUPP2825]GKT00833.1 type III secretion system export a
MDPSMQQGLGLFQLTLDLKGFFAVLALSTARIYAAMLVMPATNDMLLYGRTRGGLVLVLGAFVAWGQPTELLHSLTAVDMAVLVLKEGVIGMLIGFAVGTVFWVAESVGMLIDNQTGYNNIQQTNPLSGQQSTPVGNLLSQLAIVGFYMLGGMLVFIGLLFDSYEWWPLTGVMPSWSVLMERFLPTEVTNYAETVLKIAGPVIVILMLIDLGIGLLGKAAEKLEPNSLAQPIKGATTMLLLVLLVGVFFQQVRPQLTMRPVAERIKRLLSPAASPPASPQSPAVPHG